ncbi:MAG: DUF72 domain-containing protein [Candidatus Eremiobacteraeota bacterium]|nr:DUF72 domain-containing protein [Candidatus Eremiobacteraeota bacterium]
MPSVARERAVSTAIRIGTAGWNIPKVNREAFSTEGTALQRYAGVFNCAEINSTFYRPHRASTYERWANSVPENFAFSLKIPKEITHVRKLVACEDSLRRFIDETSALGQKRDMLLIQLPPKLAYERAVAEEFFSTLRAMYVGKIALEPRHASWFETGIERWLQAIDVCRVAADPVAVAGGDEPGGSAQFSYFRLHGAPRMYYSAYGPDRIAELARRLSQTPNAWCIFDNTASGAATGDALALQNKLEQVAT